MERIELLKGKFNEELAYKLQVLSKDRNDLVQSIYKHLLLTGRVKPVSWEMSQILKSLFNTNHIFYCSFRGYEDRPIPAVVVYEKTRLDPVWNFLFLNQIVNEWKAYVASFPKNLKSIYFELSIPHKVAGKEFFESDASSAFKILRKYPGWNRVVKEGKFYTCFKRENEKLIVTIFCIACCSTGIHYGVLKRYLNYAWKKATHLGTKLQYTTKSMQLIPSRSIVLPIQREAEYLKVNDEWDIDLIEKLIKKNCLAIPKSHDFGGSLKIQNSVSL
jgi:hypothetical protein